MRVLLLEDEQMLSKSIQYYLLKQNFLVDCFDNGQEVLEMVPKIKYDLYILDINTPLVSGIECLEVLAKEYPEVPKIVISAYDDIKHISEAFTLGCSDYMKKPFNLVELGIRIDKLMLESKMREKIESQILHLNKEYVYNIDTETLFFKSKMQKLTKKEKALLSLLVNNKNNIISLENIRSFIWDGEEVENSTVRSLVNRLRTKLQDEFIQNIRGFGYLFTCEGCSEESAEKK